jgi:phosphate transport system permease protein
MRAERFIAFLLRAAAVVSASITVLIFAFMVFLGYPLVEKGQLGTLFTHPWLPDQGIYGIYPMIVGTVWIASLALAFGFPLSLGYSALIQLADEKKPFARLLRKVAETMTGIPTVIYGFVGIFLVVPFIRRWLAGGSGMCILSAGLLLAVVISPTMILFFTDSFARVPRAYLLAANALGARPVQKLLYVVLPGSLRGIACGLVLAFGRAMGDTLIALMVAGNAVAVPGAIRDSARTLTAHIALVTAADFDSLEFRTLFACGVVLYFMTTLTVVAVGLVSKPGRPRLP